MERDRLLLQELQKRLRGWFPVIQRSLHSDTLRFQPGEGVDFFLEASGKNRDKSTWSHRQHFTRAYCLGETLRFSPEAWRVTKRPCVFARAFIGDVLRMRGVIQ